MPTVLNRATPLANEIDFYMFCKVRGPAHAIMTDPNVTTQARVRIDTVNLDKPDNTYSDYDVVAGKYLYDKNWYCKGNAINVGKRMADWQEYQGLYVGKGVDIPNAVAGTRTRSYGGSIFIQNWATGQYSGKALFKDPRDAVTHNGNQHFIGFHANACERSTPQQLQSYSLTQSISIADFTTVALQALKDECDRRNLCYPAYLAWDWEDVVGVGGMIGYGNSYERPGNPQQRISVWELVQNDPRYSTEIVCEEFFRGRWLPRTMRDIYREAGSPAQITLEGTTPRYWFQGVNREFSKKMWVYCWRMWDHALNETLYRPARRIFPHVNCGNYHVVFPISNKYEDHYPDLRDNFLRLPSDTSNFVRKRYLRADYQCPVCYSANMSAINRFSPTDYAPAASVSDPRNAAYYTKHSFGDGTNTPNGRRKIYRDMCVQLVKACVAGGNPIEVIPYIEPPFANTSASDFGAGNTHNPDESDILYVLQQHYLLGVRHWMLFNPNFMIGVTDAQAKDAADRFLIVLNQFKAWVASR